MEENQAAAIAESAWLKGQNRLRLVGLGFALCFTTIAAQLGMLTLWHGRNPIDHTASIESAMGRAYPPPRVSTSGVPPRRAAEATIRSRWRSPSRDRRRRPS